MGKKTIMRAATKRSFISAIAAAFAFLAFTETASAQEILMTGPLAGAPAVRKLRLYREGRFEIAPGATFTLLDEFQRTILLGMRLNYNFTDWLGFGVWGAYGGLIQIPAALTDEIQTVNQDRRDSDPNSERLERRLTAINLGANFEDQLGGLEWVAAPQLTAVPFRGKIALFQAIYIDTDLYFFAGPAFAGLKERGECLGVDGGEDCRDPASFELESRVAIAPTAGLGFTFYINNWSALGFEARFVPFAWNRGGFDTEGGGKDQAFPDQKITGDDAKFSMNPMLGVSFNIYLPTQYRVSE